MKLVRRILLGVAVSALAPLAAFSQVSNDVVKIGVLTDLSGPYTDGSGAGSVLAANMAVADFGGKVLGRPIQVISGDPQGKPDIGATIANKWYDNENVDVIVDVPSSPIALTVQRITREKNKVFLISGAASSELTGTACSPNGIQWTSDTYSFTNILANELVNRGLDTWSFIAVANNFGAALEKDASAVLKKRGGSVITSLRHPFNNADFSSFILQAKESKAKVVAFATGGEDLRGAIKQAYEFGLPQSGQKMVALTLGISDVHALGLQAAQGLISADAFFWDRDDQTRAFVKRFMAERKTVPSRVHVGVYSAVAHYLKAIEAAGTDEAGPVLAKMREMPVNDFFARNGKVRADGTMVHDLFLLEVKKPEESKGEWDLYKLIRVVPGDEAYRPMAEGGCPYIKAGAN